MCCSSFLKIMMFIFNGTIFVAGGVILGVGIWLRVDSDSLLGLVDEVEIPKLGSSFSLLADGSYVIIAVGAVLLVIGFLGCCGAVKESRCMLLTFFSIVLIIFLVEIAGAVVLFVFQDVAAELFQELDTEIKDKIEKDYGEDNPFTSVLNETMKQFQCCGFYNYTDFTFSNFVSGNGGVYPEACCNSTSTCNEQNAGFSDVPGCFNKLLQFISDNAVIIAAVALGIAALEIAAMVVSMILYCRAGEK